jgi:general secretion pathway protein L
MPNCIIVALPEAAAGASADAHWWRVVDGRVDTDRLDASWTALSAEGTCRLVGLAPAAAVHLLFDDTDRTGSTPSQAVAVARFEALESSLGDAETLHAVSAQVPPGGQIVTAVVANSMMLEWVDWARAAGAELDQIVAFAIHLPLDERWSSIAIGNDHIMARRGLVIPNDPALAEVLVGSEQVELVDAEVVRSALLAIAERPLLDLRTGRFARKRRLAIDRDRIRELVLLACVVPLVTLLWAVVSIVKLNSATDELNALTVELASAALGRPVTLENAEAELAQRGGGGPGLSAPLAALYQALQSEAAVTSTQIGYGSGGTFSATLAAPSHNDINRLLLTLQRNGYRVTAVPRQSPDGRTMVDLTMRVGP